ncbi:HEAT repeat domain-containing protein, partial [Candidatus Desantisbacteria bacterium]|nr:HEAT repeat domain-containing protein [Candidatus Desantisbacteria bacterium]
MKAISRKIVIISIAAAFLITKFNNITAEYNTANKNIPKDVLEKIEILENMGLAEQYKVIKELADMGDKAIPAVPILIKKLKYEDSELRKYSAQALGSIKDNSAVEPLIKALKYNDPEVTTAIVKSLGNLKDKRSFNPLIALLKNNKTKRMIRLVIVDALCDINDKGSSPVLIEILNDADDVLRVAASGALWKLEHNDKALNQLFSALKSKDENTKRVAAQTLAQLKDNKFVPFLIDELNDKESSIKENAAWILGKIKDKRAVDPLIAALNDKDTNVEMYAAEALGEIGDIKAIEPLHRVFRFSALSKIKDPEALNILTAILKDDLYGSNIRCEIADALGKAKEIQAIPALIETFKDKDADLRNYIVIALDEINDENTMDFFVNALRDEDRDVRKNAIKALKKIKNPQSTDLLIKALKDENIKEYAAEVLCETGNRKAIKPLYEIIKNKNGELSETVIEALGKIGDGQVVDYLIELSESKDPKVKTIALHGLMASKNDKAIKPLLDFALKEKDLSLIPYRLQLLENKKNKKIVEYLIEKLKDNEAAIRGNAALIIENIPDKRAIPSLIEALKDKDQNVVNNAMKALKRISSFGYGSDLFIDLLKDENEFSRYVAIYILGGMCEGKAALPLLEILGENKDKKNLNVASDSLRKITERLVLRLSYDEAEAEERRDAALLLGMINNKKTIKPLIMALDDSDDIVKKNAEESLKKITGQNFKNNSLKWKIWFAGKNAAVDSEDEIQSFPDACKNWKSLVIQFVELENETITNYEA